MRVNGRVVTELGTKVDPDRDKVSYKGKPVRPVRKLQYALLHKPTGYLTSRRDESRRPLAVHLLPPALRNLQSVGRLDMWSSGLLLFTNDGELANRLMHPRYEVPKTYVVTVPGVVTKSEVRLLKQGIMLEEGLARPLSVVVLSRGQVETCLKLVLAEGRNREVRRMLQTLGHKVKALQRTALGPLELGDLPVGRWRSLAPEEITALYRLVGLEAKKGKN